jgi:hypothetical protein
MRDTWTALHSRSLVEDQTIVPVGAAGRGLSRPLADRPIGLSPWVTARSGHGRDSLIRMQSLGANKGATRANDFIRQVDGYGQAAGDHAS